MASAVASKGAPLAVLLRKLLAAPSGPGAPAVAYYVLRPASVAGARRLFNSGGSPLSCYYDEEEVSSGSDDDVAVDDHRRTRDFSGPVFSSADLVDPFGAAPTLGRLLSKLEDAARSGRVAPRRGWWVAKQDDDAVTLKVPMPGLGKEHVKVWAEQDTLVIKGEGDKELADGDEDHEVRYNSRIELPADAFKVEQVRAEVKNGLLKVTVPKVKDMERKDVFHVTVE